MYVFKSLFSKRDERTKKNNKNQTRPRVLFFFECKNNASDDKQFQNVNSADRNKKSNIPLSLHRIMCRSELRLRVGEMSPGTAPACATPSICWTNLAYYIYYTWPTLWTNTVELWRWHKGQKSNVCYVIKISKKNLYLIIKGYNFFFGFNQVLFEFFFDMQKCCKERRNLIKLIKVVCLVVCYRCWERKRFRFFFL